MWHFVRRISARGPPNRTRAPLGQLSLPFPKDAAQLKDRSILRELALVLTGVDAHVRPWVKKLEWKSR